MWDPRRYRLLPILTCFAAPALAGVGRTDGFVHNAGQLEDGNGGGSPTTLYVHRSPGLNVLLRENGFAYQYQRITPVAQQDGVFKLDYHRIDLEAVGAQCARMVPGKVLRTERSITPERGSIEARVVDAVHYKGIYRGVDLEMTSGGEGFKYNIHCADPLALAAVRMRYSGSLLPLRSGPQGGVVLATAFGSFEERIPESLFLLHGKPLPATVRAVVDASTNEVTYALQDTWPEGATLVIDPMPHRLWATYLGGEGYDLVTRLEVDEDGGAYVTGYTDSAGNIATSGAYQGQLLGFQNCFLQKYDRQGNLLFGTYFGGANVDRCYGMVRDRATGHLYIGGSSFSPGLATAGAHQTVLASLDDALLARFDAQGALVWATYYGGNDHDFIADLALDPQGFVVLTGHTRSAQAIATNGSTLVGIENAFVARFSPGGQRVWGTYLGSGFGQGWGVDADLAGNIYVAGLTTAATGIATPGSQQPAIGGAEDAFLVKFSNAGQVLWGTYHGGPARDVANALVVCADGSVVFVGDTESASGIALPGAHQPGPASLDEGFMARYAPDGTLLQATYIGGAQVEYLRSVQALPNGGVVVAGHSESATGLATPQAFQPLPAGEYDAVVMQFSAQGQLEWGTYLGGPMSDLTYDVAIDPSSGQVLVAGITRSEAGLATQGAQFPGWLGGLYCGFLGRLCIPPAVSVVARDGEVGCGEGPFRFSLSDTVAQVQWSTGSTSPQIDLWPGVADTVEVFALVADAFGCPATTDTLRVTFQEEPFNPAFSMVTDRPLPICVGEELMLSLSDTFPAQRWWNMSTAPQAIYIAQEPGEVWLEVTVFNEAGCAARDSILVRAGICQGIMDLDDPDSPCLRMDAAPQTFVISWPDHAGAVLHADLIAMDGRTVWRKQLREGAPFRVDEAAGTYVLWVAGPDREQRHVLRVPHLRPR